MIYCTHLPSRVRARWLWRISWEPIRNGEIFWINNNWVCSLLLYKPFYFFPSRACKQFISPYMPLQTNFSRFFKPLNHSWSWTLAWCLNWSRAFAEPNRVWHCRSMTYELTLTAVNRHCTATADFLLIRWRRLIPKYKLCNTVSDQLFGETIFSELTVFPHFCFGHVTNAMTRQFQLGSDHLWWLWHWKPCT